MNLDRNTIIGFIVLALLFVGYFFYNSKEQQAYLNEQNRKDSIAAALQPKIDPLVQRRDSLMTDSLNRVSAAGDFIQATNGTEALTYVENDLIKVAFTNKGGQPKWVELKNFKAPDSSKVKLGSNDFDKINYVIKTADNKTADINNFIFSGGQVSNGANGAQIVTYQLQSSNGSFITHQYVIQPRDYMINFNLGMKGVPQLTSNNTLNITWQNKAVLLQKDLEYEKQQSHIAYRVDKDYDDESVLNSGSETFENAVNWVGVKQQFFATAFIAKNNFSSGSIEWVTPTDEKSIVQATANLKVKLPAATSATVPFSLYYGPTDYKILKQYNNDLENMVNLGSGMFAFVKYINRWIVIPAFDFFKKLSSNYGIVILLLTLFIRLLISPLTYTSYLSAAKMKVLRPEIDLLKAKYGADQQQISMEQMRLFREAGVNPLGGCIPGLFQIPIFFALYSFFNSSVDLRGANFLWANDLSQYDSILDLPFKIPFYGDHVSLFTLTAILTSFLISLYSMSMTPDQGNPVMKYMPYIFPFVLLFVFNRLPAGLTWYYTVSNIITLTLQFVIQNYIINHDKILAKIEVNRKKPKTKTKWQEKIEQMQDSQKKMQELQNKSRK